MKPKQHFMLKPLAKIFLLYNVALAIFSTECLANPSNHLPIRKGFENSKTQNSTNKWQVLKGCRLIENTGNDGDSFHIMHKNKEYVFRLYMVDCPETRYDYSERILKQVHYFNKPHQKVVQTGEIAKELTKHHLKRPFTIYTQGENAMGSKGNKRVYGFVSTSYGKDLGEILLKEGLARSYGKPPSGTKINPVIRNTYDALQKQAKSNRYGIWSTPHKKDLRLGPETSKALNKTTLTQTQARARQTSSTQGLKTQQLIESLKTQGRKKTQKTTFQEYTLSKEDLEILLPKALELDYQTHKPK